MGLILDTPTTSPFAVEVRRESAYVTTGMAPAVLAGRLDEPWSRGRPSRGGRLYVPAALLPVLREALGIIAAHPAAQATPPAPAEWTVTRQDDEYVIAGPAYLYGLMHVGVDRGPVETVEVAYADLPALLVQLDGIDDQRE